MFRRKSEAINTFSQCPRIVRVLSHGNKQARAVNANQKTVAVQTKGNSNASQRGLNTLKKAWSQLGNGRLMADHRQPVAIRKWRAELIADWGGAEAVSTEQLAIVDLAASKSFYSIASTRGCLSSRALSIPANDQSFGLCCSGKP